MSDLVATFSSPTNLYIQTSHCALSIPYRIISSNVARTENVEARLFCVTRTVAVTPASHKASVTGCTGHDRKAFNYHDARLAGINCRGSSKGMGDYCPSPASFECGSSSPEKCHAVKLMADTSIVESTTEAESAEMDRLNRGFRYKSGDGASQTT